MANPLFNINTGFIEQPPTPTDYIAGVNSPIAEPDLLLSGNYSLYLPDDERQSSHIFDALACVTFSNLNCLETQGNLMLAFSLLPTNTIMWLQAKGYIINGKFNFSDRFTAKMSGTTKEGNSLQKVADSVRHDGLVPESVWPWQRDTFTWDDYYAPIDQSVIDLGKEFLEYFTIPYHFINDTDYKAHLIKAPIQIATAVCSGWSDPAPVPTCQLPVQHATMIYNYTDHADILDHYIPFLKELAADYVIPWKFQVFLIPKNIEPMSNTLLVKKGQEFGFYIPCTTPEALLSYGKNFGKVLPQIDDHTPDWSKITPDLTI